VKRSKLSSETVELNCIVQTLIAPGTHDGRGGVVYTSGRMFVFLINTYISWILTSNLHGGLLCAIKMLFPQGDDVGIIYVPGWAEQYCTNDKVNLRSE